MCNGYQKFYRRWNIMKKSEVKINRFSANLKDALSGKWTQKRLAKKLGTTQQCVSRWVNGDREPSIDDIILICHFLNEDPSDLIGFNDISPDEFKKFDDIFKKE